MGEYGIGVLGQQPGAGLRLPGRDPLLRRLAERQRRPRHRSSRTPSACTRKTTGSAGSTWTGGPGEPRSGAPAPAGHLDDRHRRQLREYGYFWYLYQDGTDRGVRGQADRRDLQRGAAAGAAPGPRHAGRAAGLYGPHHQHFFGVRLDMMLDGPGNTVVECDSVALPPGPTTRTGNSVGGTAELRRWPGIGARSGSADPDGPLATGGSINPNRAERRGQKPVAYKLVPQGDSVLPFEPAGDSRRDPAGASSPPNTCGSPCTYA